MAANSKADILLLSGPQGQQPKAGTSSILLPWLTQSLAAIKRRSRSTDDGQLRMAPSPNGNPDVNEQHQTVVNTHPSQALPAGTQADTPAGLDTAQHAQQAVPVKRKRGRPRKVPPKPVTSPVAGPSTLPLSSTTAGTGAAQQGNAPASLPDAAQTTISPPAAPAAHSINPTEAVPAGALMPHKRNPDSGKQMKAGGKAQPPSSKASGSSSMGPAQGGSPGGAIIPESVSAVPVGGQAAAHTGPQTAPALAAAAAASAVSAAAAAAAGKPAVEDGRATATVTEAVPATVSESGHTAAAAAAALEGEVAFLEGLEAGGDPAMGQEVMPVELPGSPVKKTWESAKVATVRRQSEASAATLSAPKLVTRSSGESWFLSVFL